MIITLLSRGARVRTSALFTAALLGSLSGCTTIKNDRQRPPTEGAPTGEAAGTPESALDSQIAGLNRQIEARRKYNAGVRDWVSTKEEQLASVLAAERTNGPTVQEFDLRTAVNSEIGKLDRAAQSWQGTIDAYKAVLKGASADARGPELEAEINRLVEERAELLRQRARLISINEKLAK